MRQVHIEVCENSIQINHLEVPVKEVADFRSIPPAGKNLRRQIGADDGQVLSPVKKLVNEASSETVRRINDLKTLLSEDLDPKSAKSVLGAALQTLRDFLNPKNTESIQNVLDQA